ncbi:MAG: hypothetical protein Q8O32_01160, partial [bacterium]|nr:hypothetical protein [bacterium]
DKCNDYPNENMCENNECYGVEYLGDKPSASGSLERICYWEGNKCSGLASKECSSNADCQLFHNPDPRDWCCWKNNLLFDFVGRDYCRPIDNGTIIYGGVTPISIDDCHTN